jgi:hypothetical protein
VGEVSASSRRSLYAVWFSAGLLISLACCLSATAGCGTSVYAEKFNKRLDELKITSAFAELRQPTDDLPINFRIPRIFTEAYDRNSAHPLDAQSGQPKRVHRDRVAPPFMQEFPGLRAMYQVELDEPPPPQNRVQTLPVYCYLGEGATASVKGKFPYDVWLAQIRSGLHDPDIKGWETVEVNTPEVNAAGQVKKLTWKRLVAKGKQEFDMVDFSTREFKTVDGYFELWVYETPDWTAVLGWRAPQSIVERIHLSELAKLTAGTAVVNPAMPPPSEKEKGVASRSADSDVATATPEQALRTFLTAMMLTRDEATLRAVTLPTEDFDWLLRGEAPPADHIEEAKAWIAQPIRALKPGDEITLPGNNKHTVYPEEVDADHAVLLREGDQVPFPLQRVDGRWRVDARPLIAGRKAADAVRRRNQPN